MNTSGDFHYLSSRCKVVSRPGALDSLAAEVDAIGDNPISEGLALQGIRLLHTALVQVAERPGDEDVRAEAAIEAVEALQQRIGVPPRLRETGLDRSATEAEALALLEAAW